MLGLPLTDKYIHFKFLPDGRKKPQIPAVFNYLSELFSEAKSSERFHPEDPLSSTAKSIFLSLTETMPPHNITLKYPERDFKIAWKRLNSGIFSRKSRSLYYLILHERSSTKERGFRLQGNRYDSPHCPKGCNEIESQTHKYATCSVIYTVLCCLRDKVETIEPELVFVSDSDLLHLNFPRLLNDNTIIWLLGQYVEYIEEECVLKNNKVSVSQFMGISLNQSPIVQMLRCLNKDIYLV